METDDGIRTPMDPAFVPPSGSMNPAATVARAPADQADGAPSLVVSEVFGPTFQGEGPSIGRVAAFVRLGGCNLHCVWCDTPYTWDASRHDLRHELERRPVADILAEVAAMGTKLTVVTGGEPLLWQGKRGWHALLDGLAELGAIEVETNGTVVPDDDHRVYAYNVSPKLAHAGDPADKRTNLVALHEFARLARLGRANLKIVVAKPSDVIEASTLAETLTWPRERVYVMPQGTTVDEIVAVTAKVADTAVDEGLTMTTRLHVLAWGPERGR